MATIGPELRAAIEALAEGDPRRLAIYEREARAHQDELRDFEARRAAGTWRSSVELSDDEWYRHKAELRSPVVLTPLTRAARENSPEALRGAVVALLVSLRESLNDFRDVVILLPPYVDCARRLEQDPQRFFRPIAALFPGEVGGWIMETARRRGGDSFVFVDDPDGPLYLRNP